MNYSKHILELEKVLEIIRNFCQTSLGKSLLVNTEISNNLEEVSEKLNEVESLRQIVNSFGQIPFGGISDVKNIIQKAVLLSTLSENEVSLIRNFIYACKSILEFKKELIYKKIDLIFLSKYFDNIIYLKDLLNKIDAILDEKGVIYDYATPELNTIRKNLKKEEINLRNKLNETLLSKSSQLSDNLIVSRANRLCVCVKIEYKNSFKGVIMDYSQSGQTVYMEPLACTVIQSKISNLTYDQGQEELKILRKITLDINECQEDLFLSLNNIIYLDTINAKALYAIKYDCFKPSVNQTQNIKLFNARHPLINPQVVVPISIELSSRYKGIIITGPNTGGKTVTLKTVGLLTLMTQCGILIPADENSEINVFDQVLADIGDEQSIEQSLSTFSSHMTRIINIIDHVSLNSLILLDELGSGTDPKEGSSLAISIIKFLLERNARLIITSHYLELKEFAYNQVDLLNASVEFDIKTLRPTYRLLLGTPGKSNALEIARRLGLNEKVVNLALEHIKTNNDRVDILIDKLETRGYELNELMKDYESKLKNEKEVIRAYELKLEDLLKKEEKIFLKAKEKANIYIEEVKKDADKLLLDIDKMKIKSSTPELAEIKFKVKKLGNDFLESNLEEKEIEINDIVLIKVYHQEGLVLSIRKNKYKVQMKNMTLEFDKEELKFIRKNKLEEIVKSKRTFNTSVTSSVKREAKLELDLRGVRYEDVYDKMDKFIDNAILSNIGQVSIIHGFGTGAVRKAVQDYIRKSSVIKSSRFGKEGEGLMGVTVCMLT